jgi:hypothetical protein
VPLELIDLDQGSPSPLRPTIAAATTKEVAQKTTNKSIKINNLNSFIWIIKHMNFGQNLFRGSPHA